MPAAPSARLSLLLAGLAAACGEAAPPTPSLSVDAALVQAGDAVTVTWQAPEAATVELTDTEGRALLLGGAKQGSLQVAILRSTTLRLVARGDAADAEASVRVEARPRLVADLQANLHRAGETDFTLRWDSLGAAAWDLQVGELQEATFAGGPRGAYAGVARGQGAVPVRLRAAAEALEATWTGTVAVYPGEVEPNDALAEAGPAGAGVVGRFDPEGRDLFLVEVPEGGHVQARLQDPTGGCAARGDLRLLSEDGAVWAYAEGGASCAALGPEAAPGDRDLPAGRYRVEVTGPAEADYLLLVAVSAPVCGDGVVSTRAGEHCEPSRSPEVCRADCTVDAVAEVEPNGGPRSAQEVPLGRWVVGRVDTPGDQDLDYYAVAARLTPRVEPYVVRGGPLAAGQATLLELALDQNARLLVDTFVPAEGRCEGPGEDGRLWLDGAHFSDDGGVGRCPARGGRAGVGAVGPGVGPWAAPSSCRMIDDLTPPDFQSRRDERQL